MTFAAFGVKAAELILPLLALALTGWIGKAVQYLANQVSHIRSTAVRDALDWALGQAKDLAQSIVISLNQTTVNMLKAAGQWDATTAAKIKQQAMNLILAQLSQEARTILMGQLPNLVETLSTLIEQAVATAPNKTQAPKPAGGSTATEVQTPHA